MSNYIFLTQQFVDETIYYAIEESKIETLNVSYTYDQHGQQISNSDAGDYLEINTQAAADLANALEDSKGGYEVESVVSAYDDSETFTALLDNEGVIMYKDTCKGFTFWDGHNWKTVTVEMPHSEPTHEIVKDEALVAELNKAIEEKVFVKDGFGTKIYNSDGWTVEDNYCQGVWDQYRVYDSAINEMRNAD